MAYHNATCGCADCGNYGQIYNPGAIHNQSCGCAQCGNYPRVYGSVADTVNATPSDVVIEVPAELADEVRAFIAQRQAAIRECLARSTVPVGGGRSPLALVAFSFSILSIGKGSKIRRSSFGPNRFYCLVFVR